MGLLDVFKNIDLKDKAGDAWEYVDDPVKKVLGGTLTALNRPGGAARGALASLFDDEENNTFENIVSGWKNPDSFMPNVDTRLPDVFDKAANIGIMAATDPLTYVPVVGQAGLAAKGLRAPKLLSPMLSTVASPKSSLAKQVAGEVAVNAAARGGSEVGAELTRDTPLESVGGIAGGLVGGLAAARKFSGSTTPTKLGMVDESNPRFADMEAARQAYGKPKFDEYADIEFAPNSPETIQRWKDRKLLTEDPAAYAEKFGIDFQPKSAESVRAIEMQKVREEFAARRQPPVWTRANSFEYSIGKHQKAVTDAEKFLADATASGDETQIAVAQANLTRKQEDLFKEIQRRDLLTPEELAQEQPIVKPSGLTPAERLRKIQQPDKFLLDASFKRGELQDKILENQRLLALTDDELLQNIPEWERTSAGAGPEVDQIVLQNFRNNLSSSIREASTQLEQAKIIENALRTDKPLDKITTLDELDNIREEIKITQNNITGIDEPGMGLVEHQKYLDDLLKQEQALRQDINNPLGDTAGQGDILIGDILDDVEEQYYLVNPTGYVEKGRVYNSLSEATIAAQEAKARSVRTGGSSDEWKVTPAQKELPAAGDVIEGSFVEGLTPQQRLAMQESGDFPSVGGGALTPAQFENLITEYGYDPEVAKFLDGIAPKDRESLAQTMVDNIGAQGADAEFMRTVIQDYRKAGIQDPTKMARLNNMLRGMWATGDGSWIGIQGLLTIPRLLAKGDFKDAQDLLTVPLLTMVGNKAALSKFMHRTIDSTPADFPKLSEIGADGRLHLAFLKGNVDFDFKVWDKIIPFLKPDEAFMAAGDVARVSMFYNEWRRYGKGLTGEARTKAIEDIARAVNRATGIAEHPFGGQIGSFALFAPRFFQSQLEVVMKSFTDFGSVEGALARRQLGTLVGTGAMLTLVANYVRGEETELNPLDPNFMRIRNINGNDISVFGPWDSLVKLFVHLGQGDLTYARTKAGPLVSLAMSLVSKSDFIGNPVEDNPYEVIKDAGIGIPKALLETGEQTLAGDINPLSIVKNLGNNLGSNIDEASRNTLKSLFIPFAWQDVGNQNFTGGVANFFGVKNSPLSRSEIIDENMTNLGMDPNDPLQRRQYFADHPEDRSKFTKEQQKINEVKDDISSRKAANDQRMTNGEISLIEWRENRKNFTRESMAKMEILLDGVEFKNDTPQKKWVDSYFKLFEASQDPITKDIDGQKFDKLQASWVQANGAQAFDYVQRFLQVGKSDTELQYLQDMQQLDSLGYFSLPRYSDIVYEYSGGLSDDQIQNYRDRVSAARSVNPELAKMTFKKALQRVYGDTLTYEQIQALDYAGSDKYDNPAIDAIKEQFPHLVIWFNPKATWETYQAAKGTSSEIPNVYAIPTLAR